MNDLTFLSNCLKYDADRLNDRWLYREWISAAESFVLPLVFIIPLLIALCYMMKSGILEALNYARHLPAHGAPD